MLVSIRSDRCSTMNILKYITLYYIALCHYAILYEILIYYVHYDALAVVITIVHTI